MPITAPPPTTHAYAAMPNVSDEMLPTLAVFCRDRLADANTPIPPSIKGAFVAGAAPVYVAARRAGARQAERWAADPGGQVAALAAILDDLAAAIAGGMFSAPDTLQIDLCFGFESAPLTDPNVVRHVGGNALRGLVGLEIAAGATLERIAPSQVVATNTKLETFIDEFRQRQTVSASDHGRPKLTAFAFKSIQLIIPLTGEAIAVPMFRGNTLVDVSDVRRDNIVELQRLLGDFLVNSVQRDGRMTYMLYPSKGTEELKRNNQIRQWMATVALSRTARFRGGDAALYKKAEDNIRYNLRKFYTSTGNLGFIHEGEKIKLGAVALAALALIEHPKRSQFKKQEDRLFNTIDALFQPDGSFRTFYRPSSRNDVQNFYPGEAMLAWAFRFEESKDPALLDKFMRAFRYYRAWHREQRNPAFIPWHTQAYFKVYGVTGDRELVDFIFEMNDWLLGMQEWATDLPPDTLGRFHDPKRPQYGPPHASSTGVYMEGLIDAFALARTLGDAPRAEAYRLALVRGMRDAMQLTFRDEIDMFYLSKRDQHRGGLRTTVYDNVIRVDNVQHNQMALLKVLEIFSEDDYVHPPFQLAALQIKP